MSTEEKAVETTVETAAAQQKDENTLSHSSQEVDYSAELAKKDAEIAKISEEKENYKRGLLKAKGKIPDEDDNSSNDEDIDSKVKRLVQEQLLATREAQALAEKEALVRSLAKKNQELSLALRNRGQVTAPSGGGSSEDKPQGKTDSILSNEQLSALKAKGWDDKKIEEFKKNLVKVAQSPK